MLALPFSSSSERKWRANARNATLETLYGVQFIWFIQLIWRNHPVILHHRRSTTVSLDKNPRNTRGSHHLFNDKEKLQRTSGGMGRNLYPSFLPYLYPSLPSSNGSRDISVTRDKTGLWTQMNITYDDFCPAESGRNLAALFVALSVTSLGVQILCRRTFIKQSPCIRQSVFKFSRFFPSNYCNFHSYQPCNFHITYQLNIV